MGFGVGLLFLGPLSLVENVTYTIFVLLLGERKNSTKVLLFGTLFISAISFSAGVALISPEPLKLSYLPGLSLALIWAWYFALIPQIIIRKVSSKGDPRTPPNRQTKMIIFRIILTAVLPAVLYLVHGILGGIFGIPSD